MTQGSTGPILVSRPFRYPLRARFSRRGTINRAHGGKSYQRQSEQATSRQQSAHRLFWSRLAGLLEIVTLIAVLALLGGCQTPPEPAHNLPSLYGNLALVAFDVGQADSLFVLTPGGRTMLVDAGNTAQDATDVILPFLRQHGIDRLDYLVLTHPHQDHVGGMPAVLRNLDASVAVFSGEPSTNSAYQQFLTIVRERNMRALQARLGKTIDLGPEVQATILSPPEGLFEDANNNSVVIRVAWRGTSLLLMGDAETEAENSILESGGEIRSTVLKVGHHGSSTSSSARFLDAARPQYAVISVGANNDYGHPAQSTMDRLTGHNLTVFRTDLQGTVVFVADGSKVEVATQK